MITVAALMSRIDAHVFDKQSKVYVETVKMGEDGKPVVYTKPVTKVTYDHKNRKLIFK